MAEPTEPEVFDPQSAPIACPCTTGWDLGLAEYGDQIAYVHPDCPIHSEETPDHA